MQISKVFIMAAFAAFATTASAQFANTSNSSSGLRGGNVIVNNTDSYNRFSFDYANMGLGVKLSWDGYTSDARSEERHINSHMPAWNGLKVGYTRGISLTKSFPLFLEVGANLQYNQNSKSMTEAVFNGYDSDDYPSWAKVHSRFLSVGVPVSVAYKLSFTNGFYLEPYAGVGFKLNLMGKETIKITDSDYEDYVDSDDLKINYFEGDDLRLGSHNDDALNRFQFGGQVGLHLGYKVFDINIGSDFFTPLYKYSNSDENVRIKNNCFHVGIGFNF